MAYYMERRSPDGFEETVDRVSAALTEEGFGVLCDIDVQAAFAEKLGLEDYRRYRILGACNPALAQEGLDAERNLGVLLPCNVVVYEEEDEVVVSAVHPVELLDVADDDELVTIAEDVLERFTRVLDGIAGD